jgi:VWFA-related protein
VPACRRPTRFGTEAELVTVDVVVLGPDGKPVAGLKREDFRILEDGRPQTVRAFESVEAAVPALLAPKTATSRPSIARVATNVSAPPTRRTFAIVFDDLHVGDLNIERRAVRAFVDRDIVLATSCCCSDLDPYSLRLRSGCRRLDGSLNARRDGRLMSGWRCR